MQNTNLNQTEIDQYYKQIMQEFKPVDGFKLEDYYGVASITIKKNDHIQLRLMYDYTTHAINGSPLDVEDADDASLIYDILMSKRRSKMNHKKFKLNRLANNTSGSEIPHTSGSGTGF